MCKKKASTDQWLAGLVRHVMLQVQADDQHIKVEIFLSMSILNIFWV